MAPTSNRTRRVRQWRFDYAAAADLLGLREALDIGDVLELFWRGELFTPQLAPPGVDGGVRRRAIVVDIEEDWTSGLPVTFFVALVDEGIDSNT